MVGFIIFIIIIIIITSNTDKSNFTLNPTIICAYIRSASPRVKLRVIFSEWNLLYVWQKKHNLEDCKPVH